LISKLKKVIEKEDYMRKRPRDEKNGAHLRDLLKRRTVLCLKLQHGMQSSKLEKELEQLDFQIQRLQQNSSPIFNLTARAHPANDLKTVFNFNKQLLTPSTGSRRMPLELWIFVGQFLKTTDFRSMMYQSKFYTSVVLEWYKSKYEQKQSLPGPKDRSFLQTDLVYMLESPTPSRLRELKIPSNTAYIRCGSQLFYAYEMSRKCTISPVSLNNPQYFDSCMGLHPAMGNQYRTLSVHEVKQITNLTGHAPMVKFYRRFYTLRNSTYIPLFAAILNGRVEEAKNFLRHKLKEAVINKDQVTEEGKRLPPLFVGDPVFFQKDHEGDSVITLAQRLGRQDFLDFCFNELVLNISGLMPLNFKTIKTGDLKEILVQLDQGQMTEAALWMYGFAHVCGRIDICDQIAAKEHWQKNWINPNPHSSQHSLLLIATLLGSLSLAEYVMTGLSLDAWEPLLNTLGRLNNLSLSVHDHEFRPLAVAALSKQIEMINYLQSFPVAQYQEITLAYFYIERRDLVGLRQFEAVFAQPIPRINIPSRHYNISHDLYLSALGLAVAKNWQEGVEFLLESGVPLRGEPDNSLHNLFMNPLSVAIELENLEMAQFLINKGACMEAPEIPEELENNNVEIYSWDFSTPLSLAIEKGNLQLVKFLLDNQASLTEESSARCEYPIITAIGNKQNEITEYLFQQMDIDKVLSQIHDTRTGDLAEDAGKKVIEWCQLLKEFMRRLVLPALTQGKKSKVEDLVEISASTPLSEKPGCWPGLGPWTLISSFLERSEWLNMVISRRFVPVVSQWILSSGAQDFAGFRYPWKEKGFSPDSPITPHILSNFYRRYDRLLEASYIYLFYLITEKHVEVAIQFICSRQLQLGLADMIFFQKDANGHTLIDIARRLNLQKFLDFCFEKLIVNGSDPINRVVKTKPLAEVLASLNVEVSVSVMWMYACAYVCNQTQICAQISEAPAWTRGDRGYNRSGKSLLIIAALLGSLDLMKNIKTYYGEDMNRACSFQKNELYVNNNHIELRPLQIAAINRDKRMIQYLLETNINSSNSQLAGWYVQRRDLEGLQIYCHPAFFRQELGLSSQYFKISVNENFSFTPLTLAVAKNWLEGVEYMLSRIPQNNNLLQSLLKSAIQCGYMEMTKLLLEYGAGQDQKNLLAQLPSLSGAIRKNLMDIVKILVERGGISLREKIQTPESSRGFYPLEYAILCNRIQIARFILKEIGENLAVTQLSFCRQHYQGPLHQAASFKIQKFYDEEIGSRRGLLYQSIAFSGSKQNPTTTASTGFRM
jgi:ankyrin repeat protein